MSIRARLMIICLVVALLPAVPLTFLVRGLIEKSFNVGLSETVSGALESGIEVSRMHLEQIRKDFEKASAAIAGGGAGTLTDTTLVVTEGTSLETAYQTWKGEMLDFGSRSPLTSVEYDLTFYESTDRSVEAARLRGAGGKDLVIFREVPADFLEGSRRIIEGNQTFARLDLASGRLAVSFFYPFVIIYGIVLIIALLFAFFLAERLAGPIRRLERATGAVAAGDWTVQVKEKSGGETGRLVQRFNEMVSRLDAQRRRLADMDKISSWREMARHLAHEIKNPILPIRLTVQELKDQYPGGDEKYGEFLGESVTLIEGELSSLQALVKEFSSFARLPGLSMKEGSLAEVAGSVAALYPGSIARITADPELPRTSFDADQIRRVLINLFDNAIGVSPEGRELEITIDLKREDGSIRLDFRDNGPGIPEADITRIFDPYFTTRDDGTGLGLAVVKSIILQHGGEIEAENAAGGGACFRIRLPIVQEKTE